MPPYQTKSWVETQDLASLRCTDLSTKAISYTIKLIIYFALKICYHNLSGVSQILEMLEKSAILIGLICKRYINLIKDFKEKRLITAGCAQLLTFSLTGGSHPPIGAHAQSRAVRSETPHPARRSDEK